MTTKPSKVNPGRVPVVATTAHGKMGPAREDGGIKKSDGRNTFKPPPPKFAGTFAAISRPQGSNPAGPGGPAPATTAHGKTGGSSPDNSLQRPAPPAKGWQGSGGPNTGRGTASHGMKTGRGRVKPLIQPGSSREYAPNA